MSSLQQTNHKIQQHNDDDVQQFSSKNNSSIDLPEKYQNINLEDRNNFKKLSPQQQLQQIDRKINQNIKKNMIKDNLFQGQGNRNKDVNLKLDEDVRKQERRQQENLKDKQKEKQKAQQKVEKNMQVSGQSPSPSPQRQNLNNMNPQFVHPQQSSSPQINLSNINPIALLRQPQAFKSTFLQLANQASQQLKKQNFEKAAKILQVSSQLIDVGKNPLKDISSFWKMTVYGNLACSYQGQWKIQKSHKWSDKMQKQIERLIQIEKIQLKKKLEKNQSNDKQIMKTGQNQSPQIISAKTNPLQKNIHLQKLLKLHLQLIKLRFQHCALISQLNQHQKALLKCKSTLNLLQDVIRMILQYSHQNLQDEQSHGKQKEENFDNQMMIKKIDSHLNIGEHINQNDKPVRFAHQVVEYAQKVLGELLRILDQSINGSANSEKSLSKSDGNYLSFKNSNSSNTSSISSLPQNSTKNSFYYWQKNPQKNQQQIKKLFVPQQNLNCKRSILGVNKNKHWIDDFNIGGIMHMNQISVNDFQNPSPIEQYLFKDKLYELIIYCSVAHFTIATQQRFIDANQKKQRKNQQKKKEMQKKQKRQRQRLQRRQKLLKQQQKEKNKQSMLQKSQENYSNDLKQQVNQNGCSENSMKQSMDPISEKQNNSQTNQNIKNQYSENSQKKFQLQLDLLQNKQIQQNIQKKYGYQQKSQIFKQSQQYHLRAIDIVAKNIQFTIPYLSHLIQSYEKHYVHKKILETIVAIVEQSALSVMDNSNMGGSGAAIAGGNNQNQKKRSNNNSFSLSSKNLLNNSLTKSNLKNEKLQNNQSNQNNQNFQNYGGNDDYQVQYQQHNEKNKKNSQSNNFITKIESIGSQQNHKQKDDHYQHQNQNQHQMNKQSPKNKSKTKFPLKNLIKMPKGLISQENVQQVQFYFENKQQFIDPIRYNNINNNHNSNHNNVNNYESQKNPFHFQNYNINNKNNNVKVLKKNKSPKKKFSQYKQYDQLKVYQKQMEKNNNNSSRSRTKKNNNNKSSRSKSTKKGVQKLKQKQNEKILKKDIISNTKTSHNNQKQKQQQSHNTNTYTYTNANKIKKIKSTSNLNELNYYGIQRDNHQILSPKYIYHQKNSHNHNQNNKHQKNIYFYHNKKHDNDINDHIKLNTKKSVIKSREKQDIYLRTNINANTKINTKIKDNHIKSPMQKSRSQSKKQDLIRLKQSKQKSLKRKNIIKKNYNQYQNYQQNIYYHKNTKKNLRQKQKDKQRDDVITFQTNNPHFLSNHSNQVNYLKKYGSSGNLHQNQNQNQKYHQYQNNNIFHTYSHYQQEPINTNNYNNNQIHSMHQNPVNRKSHTQIKVVFKKNK